MLGFPTPGDGVRSRVRVVRPRRGFGALSSSAVSAVGAGRACAVFLHYGVRVRSVIRGIDADADGHESRESTDRPPERLRIHVSS